MTATQDITTVVGHMVRNGVVIDITVTRNASGDSHTAIAYFGTHRDMKTFNGCVKWLKKVLADESNNAVFYV